MFDPLAAVHNQMSECSDMASVLGDSVARALRLTCDRWHAEHTSLGRPNRGFVDAMKQLAKAIAAAEPLGGITDTVVSAEAGARGTLLSTLFKLGS